MKYRFLLLIPLLTSCSVIMASKREGFDLNSVQSARSREEFLDLAGEPISTEVSEDGDRVEIYHILKEKGSTARALMHGLLDISTGFLWEFAGTPIESSLSEKKYYSVKVSFDEEDQVKKLELY